MNFPAPRERPTRREANLGAGDGSDSRAHLCLSLFIMVGWLADRAPPVRNKATRRYKENSANGYKADTSSQTEGVAQTQGPSRIDLYDIFHCSPSTPSPRSIGLEFYRQCLFQRSPESRLYSLLGLDR